MTGNRGATNYDGCPFSHARRLQHMETEVQELAERTAGKLKQLTEEEFAGFVFLPAEDME